jgi:hypothetical protein
MKKPTLVVKSHLIKPVDARIEATTKLDEKPIKHDSRVTNSLRRQGALAQCSSCHSTGSMPNASDGLNREFGYSRRHGQRYFAHTARTSEERRKGRVKSHEIADH